MGGLFILKEKGYNCLVQILFLVLQDYEICGVIWFLLLLNNRLFVVSLQLRLIDIEYYHFYAPLIGIW